MAKKVTVTWVDDYDGKSAAYGTLKFGLDGVSYEIDLSAKNAQRLRKDLQAWLTRGVGWAVANAARRPQLRLDGRWIASRAPLSVSGPTVTGTRSPPAAASQAL
jgi:hypothetical protein